MRINSPESLAAIQSCLESQGPIVVEHRFYRGACAPHRMVFDEFEKFAEYLNTQTFAGDSIWVWSFDAVCREDNSLTHGKCPDEHGEMPERGAY